jgi:hypothetical protein
VEKTRFDVVRLQTIPSRYLPNDTKNAPNPKANCDGIANLLSHDVVNSITYIVPGIFDRLDLSFKSMSIADYLMRLYPRGIYTQILPIPHTTDELQLVYNEPVNNALWQARQELPTFTNLTFDRKNPSAARYDDHEPIMVATHAMGVHLA